ncbi:MAG: hypothetical protein CBC47_09055 [Alphaproteobacteria bacterium TMED87]|nr:MAG: hypothetical protein CBC47_09055 [Alphaproteobacteria bacterium TMED87]|tara:strand:- start:292 stop:705 length:414 start_codon:yes stop_codon:yes gene_type:complete
MKKRNVFELFELKEKIKSKTYSQKLHLLSSEHEKVSEILLQLENLSENKHETQIDAWKLKSISNIQEKINQQKEIAKYKISRIEKEKKSLTKIIAKHEIKRKRSIEKSEHLKSIENLEKEKKLETDITLKNNSFRWH